MKIVFIILPFIALTCFAQQKATNAYLLARFTVAYDNTAKRDFYAINAESGCDEAKEIYGLKKFYTQKNTINEDGAYYYKNPDTTSNYYNYFLSPTEALNYMAKKGWMLTFGYTETFSGAEQVLSEGKYLPITTISSRPVFCFKK
jgi:hypothetical protein